MAQELPEDVRNVNAGNGNAAPKQLIGSTVRETARTLNFNVIITDSGPEHTFEFEREDYTTDTMAAAAAMPVALKEEAHDTYKLKIGTNIVSVRKENGDPQPISDDAPGAVSSFMKDLDPDNSIDAGHTTFVRLSEPSKYTDYEGLTVVKGKAARGPGQKRYITEIIKDINENSGPETTALFPKKLVTSIGKFNRFTPEKVLITDGQKESNRDFSDIVAQELGTYTNHRNNPEAQNIQLRNLKNLGVQILLKASGEYFVAENIDDVKGAIVQKATSLAPGLARLGIKVPLNSFQPENVMYEVNNKFSKPKHPALADDQNFSHGSYNNPIAPFDGFDSRSSAAASAVLISTMVTLFEALSIVFSPKGGLQSAIVGDIFNVVNNATVPTKNSYSSCVREGAKVFFGLESGGSGLLGSIAGAFLNTATGMGRFNDEPGYYNLMLRNLNKIITYELFGSLAGSLVSTVSSISNVFGGPSVSLSGQVTNDTGLEINPNPGLSSDPTNILSAIRRLLDSRLIGFMNVIANIGDISLSLKAAGMDSNAGLAHAGDTFDDGYDDLLWTNETERRIKLAGLIYKNNLSPEASVKAGYTANGRPLSWGSSTTPSAWILPESILIGASKIEFNGYGRLANTLAKDPSKHRTIEPRLDYDTVVAPLEAELDAAYVPFYFHDLRTNEIVSFHAFLENINDTFDVEYAESAGYGRIGKVYSYKNTNRSIGMSFKVVSTNPEDFDMMWWKINKLVTMIYPQYTAGRTIQTEEGNRFIQPFSQLPSSSPLIRIRLGDIIRNNFSKFNLARLFGVTLGEEQFKLQNTPGIASSRTAHDTAFIETEQRNARIREGTFLPGDNLIINITSQGGPLAFDSSATSMFAEQVFNDDLVPIRTLKPATLTPGEHTIQVIDENLDNLISDSRAYTVRIINEAESANKIFVLRIPSSIGTTSFATNILTTIIAGEGPTIRRSGRNINQFRTIEVRMAPDNPEIFAGIAAQDALDAAAGNLEDDVKKFFKSDTNPVFKAFDTTKGKGLAGFIKSLRFNWNDTPWSIDGIDNRAPKCCTVELEFAPVNDLNPGIDVNGFNSAPVYRVGSLSNATNHSVGEDAGQHSADVRSFENKARVSIKGPVNRDDITSVAGQAIAGVIGMGR